MIKTRPSEPKTRVQREESHNLCSIIRSVKLSWTNLWNFVHFCKFPIAYSDFFATFASEIGEKPECKMARTCLATMEKYHKR